MATLMRLFDLIVAHEPGRWGFREALRVVKNALPGAVVFDTPRSLILLRTGEPFAAVERLRRALDEDTPILRAVPVQGETLAYVEDVAEAAAAVAREAAERLGGKPSFAVRLEGRLYSRETGEPISSRRSIEAIAEGIDLPVDLSRPKLLILVKVVKLSRDQRYAGIMAAPPSAIYSRDAKRES